MENKIEGVRESSEAFRSYISGLSDGAIVSTLEKLGRLHNDVLKEVLIELSQHKNANIRRAAVKNLAKYSDLSLADSLFQIAKNDDSTEVRRESASAIGRMRDKSNKEKLIYLLDDHDPKVVLQAMRGLIAIKKDVPLEHALSKCKNHPNEQVQELLRTSLNVVKNSKRSDSNDNSHAISDSFLQNLAIQGDTLEVMKVIPESSIHLTFTSPPYYNARDYSIYRSYAEYLGFLKEVFQNVHRITKEGRFLIVNSSPIIVPRISRAHASKRFPIPFDLHTILIDQGWEFIDDIIWLKPEASAKNRNAGFLQHRKPLAYKPNAITEMLMVYRKKTDKLIDWNIDQYPEEVVNSSKVENGYETSNVWRVDPTFDKTHSAVFPKGLCERVINYYSMKGDLVFDPFAGSGTIGRVAMEQKRFFLLTEIDKSYFARIKENLDSPSLFESTPVRFMNLKDFKEKSKNGN